MGVHLAPTLRVLREEINTRWPHRDKASDGWIGDAAHQARKSDHNPDGDDRSVNAADFDIDGIDPLLVVRQCIAHPSTQYVIFNRTIWSRTRGFRAARYTGSNPHTKHLHVSVSHSRALEDSLRPWGIATARVSKLGDRTLKAGCKGSDVRELQTLANRLGAGLAADGVFGPRTTAWVRSFQKSRKLAVDAVVGPKTLAALRAATKPPPPKPGPGRAPGSRTIRAGSTGEDVAYVKRFIGTRRCGPPGDRFDTTTESGVRWYQQMRGLTADGIVGRLTWAEMGVRVTY
ncbi:Peptidoglycan-binding (PGRP) domain of peptidoglycan hydrolases-containing protein [Micromonospora echinaurantiaca]|uniref:Peptidoglycan-binding (PGRP) domain of peptidoglycan hydrolases-containing protein n=1 Tax=Micromonospora echinaurantiaca TaxID=47857 RepID=A0A1C5IAI4_9ACTN|nr:peptidoglycan-binding protein [Micromonospora echinaurantiaca]SCG55155.1 Peptidoglycan-binding (PGRP) domain of peptidoglycan hydrolases-containing protein [Micromonospora echinaurantiaca]